MALTPKIWRAYGSRKTKQLKAALLLLVAAALTGRAASGNPLCIAADQRPAVESLLAQSPPRSPLQIAQTTGLTEAAVVHALPVDMRVPVALAGLDGLWQKLREWDDALLTVKSANRVVELFGPLPRGESDGEFFVFGGPGSHDAGRLRVDSLAAIYLVSTDSGDNEIHQVAIFDKKGRKVLSVRVPRTDAGLLQPQPHIEFLRLKEAYREVSRTQLLTDLSCLWADKNDPAPPGAREHMP